MGSRAQRRKEQKARKRQEKQKREQQRNRQPAFRRVSTIPVGSNARHRERLALQVPRAWEGETPSDVAVFDDAVLGSLPQELAGQVAVIRSALQHATQLRFDDALKAVSVIPRGSLLSDWRLFLRGLVDWLAEDTAAASEAWKRLDPGRRPGRIAASLMLALRTDLDAASPVAQDEKAVDSAAASSPERADDQLLYHAKLVRRVRFDRAAIRVAEAGTRVTEESGEMLLGPNKIQWLREFVKEYRDTEPELVAALSRTGLQRAALHPYADLFDEAARSIPGPIHDPYNKLLTYFYYLRFLGDREAQRRAEQALSLYLNDSLPKNDRLSAPVRAAIASRLHLGQALMSILPRGPTGILARMTTQSDDSRAIRDHLRAAAAAYPQNVTAYDMYADWLNAKLEDRRLKPQEQAALKAELAEVMQRWTEGLPDSIEPRLWLVDYLLENEQLEAAKPHVDFLAASRHEDPRVRATPWKWQMLEAMRLSRRKASLPEVPSRLDAAEAIWPAWLPKNWLPYLRAAWLLRTGQVEAYENQRNQISEQSGLRRDSLADACMMLGAAQQLQAPAAQLKRLREPVEATVQGLKTLSDDDLIAAGVFFWDLHRVGLVYPAYRMHGSKIGRELVGRWKKLPPSLIKRRDEESVQKALLWSSEHRFWQTDVYPNPRFLSASAVKRHPVFVAAQLNALLKNFFYWAAKEQQELATILRQAAASERDPYYRFWFAALPDQLDEAVAKYTSRSFNFPFASMFGDGGIDDDEIEDDDLDFDPNCDCPECRAARFAYQQSQLSGRNAPR